MFQDQKNHQWKSKTSIRWVLQHRPSKGIINLKMYESDKEIINTGDIIDKVSSLKKMNESLKLGTKNVLMFT